MEFSGTFLAVNSVLTSREIVCRIPVGIIKNIIRESYSKVGHSRTTVIPITVSYMNYIYLYEICSSQIVRYCFFRLSFFIEL